MSRSYKKHPVSKQSRKKMKTFFARKVRHSKDPNAYKNSKKMNCSYDICDYRCRADKDEVDEMDWEVKKYFVRK